MQSLMKKRNDIYQSFEKMGHLNGEAEQLKCYRVLQKLLSNIHGEPDNLKFRSFRKDNESIRTSILNLNGINQLLSGLGFIESGDVYQYNLDDLDNIDIGLGVINQYIENLSKKEYEVAASKSLDQNAEYQKEKNKIKKKLEEEENYKDDVFRQIEQDKIDRAEREKIRKQLREKEEKKEKERKAILNNNNKIIYNHQTYKNQPYNKQTYNQQTYQSKNDYNKGTTTSTTSNQNQRVRGGCIGLNVKSNGNYKKITNNNNRSNINKKTNAQTSSKTSSTNNYNNYNNYNNFNSKSSSSNNNNGNIHGLFDSD